MRWISEGLRSGCNGRGSLEAMGKAICREMWDLSVKVQVGVRGNGDECSTMSLKMIPTPGGLCFV